MKYVVVEIPYGCVLAIPASMAHALDNCEVIDRRSYDWDDLTLTGKPVEARFVDGSAFKPIAPIPEPAVPVVVDPPIVPIPVDVADIPF